MMTKPGKITVIAVTCIFVLVVAVLAYSFVRPDPEPGLLTACIDTYGQFEYAASCPPVMWPKSKFPLHLSVEGTDAHTVTDAARDWNNQLGFEAFLADDQAPNVIVRTGEPRILSNTEGGDTIHAIGVMGMNAGVQLFTMETRDAVYYAAFHELGHVLGLAHDPFQDSPMYPYIQTGVKITHVTDNDRRLLRTLYAN